MKKIALFLFGLGSLVATGLYAQTASASTEDSGTATCCEYVAPVAVNSDQEPVVPCNPVPCAPDTVCNPAPCNPAPCNPAPCNPAPAEPAPCNPGC